MTDKQTALLKASEAAAAVDQAKAGIDAAKAALEAARGILDEAKANFEAALETCETAGIPKAKARKAIEALNRIWIETGILEGELPVDAPVAEAPKRKPRKAKADAAEAAEPAVNGAVDAASVTEGETVSTVGESATQPEEASIGSSDSYITEAVEELEVMIVDSVPDVPPFEAASDAARKFLLSALHAEAWASSAAGGELDADTFRSKLTFDRVAELSTITDLPSDVASNLAENIADRANAEHILGWFASALSAIEDGKEIAPLYVEAAPEPAVIVENGEEEPVEDEVVVGQPVEVPETAEAVLQDEAEGQSEREAPVVAVENPVADVEDGDAYDDYVSDDLIPDLPDYDEELDHEDFEAAPELADDDQSFTVDDEAEDHGEVVADIGEINFLDEKPEQPQSSDPTTAAPGSMPVAETPKPQPPRGNFAPPSFLKKK